MPRNSGFYRRVNRILEKLEVITALSPALESDAQAAYTLKVLLEIANDYTLQLRAILDVAAAAAAQEDSGEVEA